jgi:hypothetical protein
MPDADPAQTRPAVLALIRDAWKRGMFPVYLWGKTGTGKSYAAAVVAQGWWERECRAAAEQDREPRRPFWWSWPKFCETLTTCRNKGYAIMPRPDGGDYELFEANLWRLLREPRLLVVDEIGTRIANEVRLEAMWQLLEVRDGLPTILTGNLDQKSVADAFDARVLSRMSKGQWIKLEGADRRAEGFGSRSAVAKA